MMSKKQLIFGLTAILFMVSAVTLTSCKKNNNDNNYDITSGIVGTWTCSNHWYGGSDTYVFNSNGKYQWTGPSSSESGDYSFNGVLLTTSSTTGVTRWFTIMSLTDTNFVMMDQEAGTYTYYKGGYSPGNGGGNNGGGNNGGGNNGGGNNGGGISGGGTGSYNGHEYVDLGLPSGTLWATSNVGASKPEGYGNYYAWGETTSKTSYLWSTYKYCNGSYTELTKYCYNKYLGYNNFTDNLTILQPVDDAATVQWGGGWRIPTKAEWMELCQYTQVSWTTQNGMKGALFTALNGNSLFLPAAGEYYGTYLDFVEQCKYWSSSLGTDRPDGAFHSYINESGYVFWEFDRCAGLSVRPVYSVK